MYGVDVAELAVKISEGALYPNLGLTAAYTQSYDTQPQSLRQTDLFWDNSRSRFIRAAVNIPPFAKTRTRLVSSGS